MGYSRAEKEKTHKRIVAIAAKRFRENGLDGVGIADLMKEAGLTVGGFYKHFKSREAWWPKQSAPHWERGNARSTPLPRAVPRLLSHR